MKFLNIKSTMLLITALLFSFAVSAQDYSFMVLGAKGDNKVDGNDLKVGAQLKSSQSINVGNGAYLGLAHSSGKTLEIKKEGSYTVKDLEAKLTKLSDNTTGQIAMFILDELTSDDNKSNRFSSSVVKTGSVTRTIDSNPVQVMLPTQSEFLPGKVTIKWYVDGETESPEKYTFVAKNLKSQEVIRKEVTGNSVELDLSELSSFDSKLLKYQILSEGNLKSEEYGLKLPRSSKDVEKLNSELSNLPEGNSAMNHFLRAEFFAQKGMLANAINSYEAAGDAFEDSYNEFLNAFKLSKEAREAAKDKKSDNNAGE